MLERPAMACSNVVETVPKSAFGSSATVSSTASAKVLPNSLCRLP